MKFLSAILSFLLLLCVPAVADDDAPSGGYNSGGPGIPSGSIQQNR